MIIKAYKNNKEISLNLLGTKGFNNHKIKVIYKCDECKKYYNTNYSTLKFKDRLKKQLCRACSKKLDPKIKERNRKISCEKWRKNNPNYLKNWKRNNKEKCRIVQKRIDTSIKGNINKRMRTRINKSLRCNKNSKHWETIVGYTINDFIKNFESKFVEDMSWNNRNKWHIDHIIPISSFNFKTENDLEFKKCWSLNNLQPLWIIDNLKKGSKLNWKGDK